MFVLNNYGVFSVCFAPFGRCMVFGFLNNFVSQPISGNSNVMSLEEVTLERITKNNTRFVMVLLRPVYHEMKKMESIGKNPWWKGIVRLVDKKGQGLYAEIRGGTEQLPAQVLEAFRAGGEAEYSFPGRLFGRCDEDGEGHACCRSTSQHGALETIVSCCQVEHRSFDRTLSRLRACRCGWRGDIQGDAGLEDELEGDIVAER